MPSLKRKSHQKEFHGDDKIYHYGNHKLYHIGNRPGYNKRKEEAF